MKALEVSDAPPRRTTDTSESFLPLRSAPLLSACVKAAIFAFEISCPGVSVVKVISEITPSVSVMPTWIVSEEPLGILYAIFDL